MPRFLERSVELYSQPPTPEEWASHIATGKPFLARNAAQSKLTIETVHELGAEITVSVVNQANQDEGQANLREVVECLEEEGAIWYMRQQPVPGPLQKFLPAEPVPGAQGIYKPNLWLGGKGATTAVHRDFVHNLVVGLDGVKEFTLLSPADDIYVHPTRSTGRGGNMAGLGSLKQVSASRFPNFRSAKPITFELRRGDLLFLPAFWWHEVHTIEKSLMLNYWWPIPLDLFFRGDIQEMINSPSRVLSVLEQNVDLRPLTSDQALVEKLAVEGFSLLAAVVLGAAAEDFVRALQLARGMAPGESVRTTAARLHKRGDIDEHLFRGLGCIWANGDDAGAHLGQPAPYPEFHTRDLMSVLSQAHERYAVPAWNRVCRSNRAWLTELKNDASSFRYEVDRVA